MIIDRPTPATQNGLENVIRGWPKWMFCKAFKKHKLCSSWRVQKAYLVGIAKSFADFCTCFSLVITPHNMSVSILFVCTATHVPWRRVQKAYLVGIATSFADFCTCFSLVITPHKHVCLHPLCLHCYTCAVMQGTKSLFSGNCQVICWFLHLLQLGHYST